MFTRETEYGVQPNVPEIQSVHIVATRVLVGAAEKAF